MLWDDDFIPVLPRKNFTCKLPTPWWYGWDEDRERKAFYSDKPTIQYINLLVGAMNIPQEELSPANTKDDVNLQSIVQNREETAKRELNNLPVCPVCKNKPHLAQWLVEDSPYEFNKLLTEDGLKKAILRYGCSCYDHSGDGDQAWQRHHDYWPSWVKLAKKTDIDAAKSFWEETVSKRNKEVLFQNRKKRWIPIAEAFAEVFAKHLAKQKS